MRVVAKRPRVLLFGVLAWYTGHRSKSIRFLRWSDLDLEAGTVVWRGANDKLGYEHKNPLHPDAVAALKRERARVSAIGDAFLFPSQKFAGKPAPTWQVTRWWGEFSRPVDFGNEKGWGWHSMRRAFANTLRNVPLRDLSERSTGTGNGHKLMRAESAIECGLGKAKHDTTLETADRGEVGKGWTHSNGFWSEIQTRQAVIAACLVHVLLANRSA